MKKVFIDTETIDYIDNVSFDVLSQLAFIVTDGGAQPLIYNDYCKPDNYMLTTPESMEVTDIVPEFLENQPQAQTTKSFLALNELSKEESYIFAHNAKFDLGVIERTGIDNSNFKVIDTLKVARFINDSLGLPWNSCRLQYLKYFHKLYLQRDKLGTALGVDMKNLGAHNALNDVIDLILLWNFLKTTYNITEDQAVELTSKPMILKYMPSGKYKGEIMTELDANTLRWQAENSYDESVKYTCEHILSH